RDAIVDVVGFREVDNVFKGLAQDEFKLLVDGRLLPEVSLAVLDPLEVGGGDAAGVGQDVRDDEDALVGEDLVRGGGGGAGGAFADDFGLDAGGVLAGDDVLSGGGDQDVAIGEQEFLGVGGFGLGEAGDGLVAVTILEQIVDIDAARIVEPAIVLGDAGDFV